MLLVQKTLSGLSPTNIHQLMVVEGFTNSTEFHGRPPGTLRFNLNDPPSQTDEAGSAIEVVMSFEEEACCSEDTGIGSVGETRTSLYGESDFNTLPFANRFTEADFEQR